MFIWKQQKKQRGDLFAFYGLENLFMKIITKCLYLLRPLRRKKPLDLQLINHLKKKTIESKKQQ